MKLFSFLGEKCFPIFYLVFFQGENLKVPTVSCLNGFSVCSVIYSFNVNGAPPSPLPACVVQTLSSECRAGTPIVRLLTRCEGVKVPQDPGPEVPQQPMHSSSDAPLFSINVFAVTTCRLRSFHCQTHLQNSRFVETNGHRGRRLIWVRNHRVDLAGQHSAQNPRAGLCLNEPYHWPHELLPKIVL